jgi:uncharacterized protein YmfQ (DUF2313 family)
MTLSDDDFTALLLGLLPRGWAWPRDPDGLPAQTLAALAPTLTRLHAAANGLLIDSFPATTDMLLPDWESSLGLPDPCIGEAPDLQTRRASVVERLTSRGGQSVSYFTGVAAALGFTITVTEYWPFCADQACELPDNDPAWAFAWQVSAPQITTFYFSADLSSADDPLETDDGTELICRLQEIAPAHTTPFFVFS